MQRDRVNIALSVQLPLTLAASRVGVVGSVVAMARITPSQPNDAMARIASRRNRTISLELESKLFFGRES